MPGQRGRVTQVVLVVGGVSAVAVPALLPSAACVSGVPNRLLGVLAGTF